MTLPAMCVALGWAIGSLQWMWFRRADLHRPGLIEDFLLSLGTGGFVVVCVQIIGVLVSIPPVYVPL